MLFLSNKETKNNDKVWHGAIQQAFDSFILALCTFKKNKEAVSKVK